MEVVIANSLKLLKPQRRPLFGWVKTVVTPYQLKLLSFYNVWVILGYRNPYIKLIKILQILEYIGSFSRIQVVKPNSLKFLDFHSIQVIPFIFKRFN